ncbi:hypothetical protein A2662_02985 [Candidatus Giovannonibacteria bacterium RIFCSPHIGHO2_01_FULL_45_33]|uniref:Uncharacterized protein n=1 Tax=Candidatus Giovannonibacteria bacterium RIFCSPLOWO2_01_FULL_45_34 TaxID=1798351 RepID=A0A1F5X2L1_9BACT|nr:MAG: hypothetical protein A2662_02985 [Candidatus Giovannonibacteria bacterium RIFCSPHIGHO2_01_FULL_45_33]OGF81801.1 MAG: hypothetical protein A2930_01395 [Candidatus Giovannonibacteria bacterium RIFCSPLOWO2_01_FULL_45_34]
MSIEENKSRIEEPENDGALLTPAEEMKRRRDEFDFMKNLELRISRGEVKVEPVPDKDTKEEIGVQYTDKKTGEIIFWENTKKYNSARNRQMGVEEI